MEESSTPRMPQVLCSRHLGILCLRVLGFRDSREPKTSSSNNVRAGSFFTEFTVGFGILCSGWAIVPTSYTGAWYHAGCYVAGQGGPSKWPWSLQP